MTSHSGRALTANPAIDKYTFTGSSAVGKEIAEVLMHVGVYAGVPAANSAFALAKMKLPAREWVAFFFLSFRFAPALASDLVEPARQRGDGARPRCRR